MGEPPWLVCITEDLHQYLLSSLQLGYLEICCLPRFNRPGLYPSLAPPHEYIPSVLCAPGILVEQWVVLDRQVAVVFFFQYGHELKEVESSAHIQFCEVAIESAEDAGVIATDEGALQRCNSGWPLMAPAKILLGATRTLKVSWVREMDGCSSISMIENGVFWGYQGEARGRGESDRPNYLPLSSASQNIVA